MVSKMLVIALAGVVVAIIVGAVTIESTEASVDYWLDRPESLYIVRGPNHVTAYCRNGGGMDGDFSLVVTFVNATFSNQTAMPYLQVDNSTVKFRFLLHKGDSNQKEIDFSTGITTTSFSITLALEKTNFWDLLKANPMYPTQLVYQWNESANRFNCVNAA